MYNLVFPTESRDVTLSDIGKIKTEKPVDHVPPAPTPPNPPV